MARDWDASLWLGCLGALCFCTDQMATQGNARNETVHAWNASHALCVLLRGQDNSFDRNWLMVGQLLCHTNADPMRLRFATKVRALAKWTGREVLARCVKKLVDNGAMNSLVASYESLLALAQNDPALARLKEPSWEGIEQGHPISAIDCRRVIDIARVAVDQSAKSLSDGNVTVLGSVKVKKHPCVKYALALRDRRVVHCAVQAVRGATSLADMPLEQQVVSFATNSASALGRVRSVITVNPRSAPASRHAVDRSNPLRRDTTSLSSRTVTKSRVHRRRIPVGFSMPKVLPAQRMISSVLRHAVDSPDSPDHAMLTLTATRVAVAWHYISGSASQGVRLYRRRNGTVKRLAASYLRRLKLAASPTAQALPANSTREATVGQPASPDVNTVDGMCNVFHVTRQTFLERVDGTERDVVIGIEFNITQSLQRELLLREDAPTEGVLESPAQVTLAGEGVRVRRPTMTVNTLTVSTSALRTGGTSIIPVLFLLSGEEAIHSAAGVWLHKRFKVALRTTHDTPVGPTSESGTLTTAQLRVPFLV